MVLATSVLSKSVLPKVPRNGPQNRGKTSTQAAALKAQPDADKTLNMILPPRRHEGGRNGHHRPSRQIAYSDYMIVTSAGQPARRRDRRKCCQSLEGTGIKNLHVEGLPNCDWVLIDSGDVSCTYSDPRSVNSTISRDCGRRFRRRRRRLTDEPMRIGMSAC